MKNALPAIVCALALGSIAALPASANPAACAQLTLTAHPDYPPVAWSHDGTLEGAGIEIVRRLAKDAGVALLVTDEGSWAAAQSAVRDGKDDAIVGLYITQARMPFFDYVLPAIASDPSAVVIRAGQSFSYKGWNSLIGKRGVAGDGESYGKAFDAFAASRLNLTRVANAAAIYDAVEEGSADYGLIGYYSALTGAPKTVRIAESNFVTEGLYIAFGKHSPCTARLASAFSRELPQLIAAGTVTRLMGEALTSYKASH